MQVLKCRRSELTCKILHSKYLQTEFHDINMIIGYNLWKICYDIQFWNVYKVAFFLSIA